MSRTFRRVFCFGLAAGFGMGLCLAAGFSLGWFASTQNSPAGLAAWLQRQDAVSGSAAEDVLLKAASAARGDSLSMATGSVDPGVEALFVLDHTSGNLFCWVVDRRNGKGFISQFATNVRADFGPVAQGRNPDYVMVTGAWDAVGAGVQGRPAGSVCYVADANSGAVVGYSMLWNRNLAQQSVPQQGALIKIAEGIARDNSLIREQ